MFSSLGLSFLKTLCRRADLSCPVHIGERKSISSRQLKNDMDENQIYMGRAQDSRKVSIPGIANFFPRIYDSYCGRVYFSPNSDHCLTAVMWKINDWLGKNIVVGTC